MTDLAELAAEYRAAVAAGADAGPYSARRESELRRAERAHEAFLALAVRAAESGAPITSRYRGREARRLVRVRTLPADFEVLCGSRWRRAWVDPTFGYVRVDGR